MIKSRNGTRISSIIDKEQNTPLSDIFKESSLHLITMHNGKLYLVATPEYVGDCIAYYLSGMCEDHPLMITNIELIPKPTNE